MKHAPHLLRMLMTRQITSYWLWFHSYSTHQSKSLSKFGFESSSLIEWDRMSISFKTDLCMNKPHECSKRDWQQRSVPVWWLIRKILWRNADKTAQKITVLQALSVSSRIQFDMGWYQRDEWIKIDIRGVLQNFCNHCCMWAEQHVFLQRPHTHLLLVQKVAVPLYPLMMYSIYLLFSHPPLSILWLPLSSGPNTSISLTCTILFPLCKNIHCYTINDISNDQTVKWSLKLVFDISSNI